MKLVHYWERVRPRVVRHGYTPGIKKIRNQNVRRAVGLLNTVKWYMLHPGYIFHSGLYYSNMELVITNKCTLKCRKCCHYIYKYQNTAHIPAQVLIEDMKKLLDSIRWVDEFRVLGGEPLLHPELCEIVTFLLYFKENRQGGNRYQRNTVAFPRAIGSVSK